VFQLILKDFFCKKHVHFKKILNYILFKLFSIASYNLFHFSDGKQVNSAKKCSFFEAIYSSEFSKRTETPNIKNLILKIY